MLKDSTLNIKDSIKGPIFNVPCSNYSDKKGDWIVNCAQTAALLKRTQKLTKILKNGYQGSFSCFYFGSIYD